MTELSFEKALSELEGIVEQLEKGDLPLNKSLALFEKGVKMARFLREELDKAGKKVEILLRDEKGDLKSEPFELTDKDSGQEKPEKGEEPDSEDNDTLSF